MAQMANNDIYLQIKTWIYYHHKFDAASLASKACYEVILPGMSNLYRRKAINEKIASRCLQTLGLIWSKIKNTIYMDGHEWALAGAQW